MRLNASTVMLQNKSIQNKTLADIDNIFINECHDHNACKKCIYKNFWLMCKQVEQMEYDTQTLLVYGGTQNSIKVRKCWTSFAKVSFLEKLINPLCSWLIKQRVNLVTFSQDDEVNDTVNDTGWWSEWYSMKWLVYKWTQIPFMGWCHTGSQQIHHWGCMTASSGQCSTLKAINLVLKWQVKVLHLITDSACMHLWVANTDQENMYYTPWLQDICSDGSSAYLGNKSETDVCL